MKKLLSLAMLLFVPLPLFADTILVLGDSISAAYGIPSESGWVALLEGQLDKKYPQQFDVVNASISGETTAGGLFRIPSLLDKYEPALVIVELGGNDGLRGMSLRQMETNLKDIVNKSADHGSEVVLLSVNLPVNYGPQFNRMFKNVFQRIGESEQVKIIDMGFDDLNDRNLLQEDGIHPTSAAQPVLFRLIWATIHSIIESLASTSN